MTLSAASGALVATAARALQAHNKVAVQVVPATDAKPAVATLVGKEADVQAVEALLKVRRRRATRRTWQSAQTDPGLRAQGGIARRLQEGDFVTAEVPVPGDGKRTGLTGQKARQISDGHGVSVTLPPIDAASGVVKLVGAASSVQAASAAVLAAIASPVRGATVRRTSGHRAALADSRAVVGQLARTACGGDRGP